MMNKLHFLTIFLLLLCVSFNGYSDNPHGVEAWSTPVSFELMPVALIDWADGNMNAKYAADFSNDLSGISSFAANAAFVAPPCIIGNSCSDGDANTVNDRFDANCDCVGEPIATTCAEFQIAYEINGGLIQTGAAAITISQTDSIELFGNSQDYVVRDPNGDIIDGNTINNITLAQAGDYTVNTTFRGPIPTVSATPIVHSVSSDMPGELGAAALDNNINSWWHTTWVADQQATDPGYPHELVIDMGAGSVLSGFSYLPRQGGTTQNSQGRIREYEIYVSNSTGDWGAPVTTGEFENTTTLKTVAYPEKQGRFMRFRAISPQNPAHPWASAATISARRVNSLTATASSQETAATGHLASSAVDGNPNTFWHSKYTGEFDEAPHSITIDLGVDSNVSGLTYRPRQSGGSNGTITSYQIFMSNLPDEWSETPDLVGTWNLDAELKTAEFESEKRGRYMRLVSITAFGDGVGLRTKLASAAEISPIRTTVNLPCSKTITINVVPRNTYSVNNGIWTPAYPAAGTTANDIIIINQGNFILDDAMTCRNLIVNPGASLTLNADGILTANSTTLKSRSDSFSSLIIDGGALTGILNYERWVNQIGTSAGGGNDLISSPLRNVTFNNAFRIANPNLPENQNNLGEFAFAPYNVVSGAYENFNITSGHTGSHTIISGVGYRAATNVVTSQIGNTLTFTGSAATGNVDIAITAGGAGKSWNLIGNPYPSYINVGELLTPQNLALMDIRYGAIYGYKGSKNGWEVINRAVEEGLIAPGQGFFIKATTGGGNIQFTPAMRRVGSSDDFIVGRTANSNKALSKLKLTSGSNDVSTSIYFIEGSTKGLDPGYDAAAYGATKVDFSLFTNLLEDNTGLDIAIQSLPYDDFNNVIVPLGLKAKAGVELSISIDDLSTLPSNINVYLEDTQNKTLTLLNDGEFKFTPTAAINGSGRFNVHYAAKTLSFDDLDASDNLRVYTTATPRTLFIKGQLSKATTANLYDIQGRLVLSKVLNSSTTENTMDISTLGTGIYVVKVNNDNQIKTQKVIIK